MDAAKISYRALSYMLKQKYIENGMDEKTAEKKAIEDARFVLPNAACTSMVMTMNARELLHFFRLRCCNRAQWEIREVADEMLRQCQEVAPTLFDGAGAPCVAGKCPEGKMSCGKPRKEN
jgi:thymidylate synthase (FAD)